MKAIVAAINLFPSIGFSTSKKCQSKNKLFNSDIFINLLKIKLICLIWYFLKFSIWFISNRPEAKPNGVKLKLYIVLIKLITHP